MLSSKSNDVSLKHISLIDSSFSLISFQQLEFEWILQKEVLVVSFYDDFFSIQNFQVKLIAIRF